MKKKKERGPLKGKKIEFASTEKVDAEFLNLQLILNQIKKIANIPAIVFVSDESSVGDFLMTRKELRKLEDFCGFSIEHRDLLVEVAKKFKEGR